MIGDRDDVTTNSSQIVNNNSSNNNSSDNISYRDTDPLFEVFKLHPSTIASIPATKKKAAQKKKIRKKKVLSSRSTKLSPAPSFRFRSFIFVPATVASINQTGFQQAVRVAITSRLPEA